MYVVLRLISLVLVVVALMLLGADTVTSLDKGGVMTVRSIAEVWALLSKTGAAGFTAWTQHSLPGPLPHWIAALLALPGWLVTGSIGIILAFLFGRRVADVGR